MFGCEPVTSQADAVLPDGSYDVIVVDAERLDGDAAVKAVRLDLTVLGGDHKGEVVTVRATGLTIHDPLDLLGVPGTLVVSDGKPVFTPER
jgi:hypothetical protein